MKQIYLLCAAIIIFSCTKNTETLSQQSGKNNDQHSTNVGVVMERVDNDLLDKYIAYELTLEANIHKGVDALTGIKEMTKEEFNAMIDNYLINERNGLRADEQLYKLGIKPRLKIEPILKSLMPDRCIDAWGEDVPCGGGAIGNYTVSCTGTFTGTNTAGTIVFVATLNNQLTIVNSGFGFGGITGTWTPIGNIVQEKSPDGSVISYKQYYTESYSSMGFNYSQTYVMYGNIYDKTCTVKGMRVTALK